MRTFAHEQRPAPQVKSASSTARRPAFFQRVGGNQAVRRLLGHGLSHGVQQTVQQTTGPVLQRRELTTEAKVDRVVRAAARARLSPDDPVQMMISGAEIVYGLIDLYLPSYRDLLSGVSYESTVARIRTESTAGDTVSISVGKKFIRETNGATLAERAAEIMKELSRWKSGFKVDPDESELFRARVWALMDELMTSSQRGLQLLYFWILHSPVPIAIRSVTADESTWHVSERGMDPDERPGARKRRSHTEPADSKPRGAERSTLTGSTIFINPFRLKPSDASYKRGIFVHELVHAFDLAYGRYNSDVTIRERRAVFFENMWRATKGGGRRESYHGDFTTDDYQRAVRADRAGRPNGVAAVTAYLLSHNDLPQESPRSNSR